MLETFFAKVENASSKSLCTALFRERDRQLATRYINSLLATSTSLLATTCTSSVSHPIWLAFHALFRHFSASESNFPQLLQVLKGPYSPFAERILTSVWDIFWQSWKCKVKTPMYGLFTWMGNFVQVWLNIGSNPSPGKVRVETSLPRATHAP